MRAFDWRQLKFFRSVWIRSFPSTIPKRYRLLLSFEIHQFAAAHHVMWSTVIVSYSSVFFLFLFSRQKLRSHFRSHTKQLTVIDSFCSFDVAVGGCDGGDSGGGGDRFRFEIFQWTFHWVISFCHWGFTSLYHLQFDVSFTFQFLSLTLLSHTFVSVLFCRCWWSRYNAETLCVQFLVLGNFTMTSIHVIFTS